jgi:hypothetical protein
MNLQGIRESKNYTVNEDSFMRTWNAYLQGSIDPLGINLNKDPIPYSVGDSLSQAQLNYIKMLIDSYQRGQLNYGDKIPKGSSYDNNWFRDVFAPNQRTTYGH